jgi:hypothetical protein
MMLTFGEAIKLRRTAGTSHTLVEPINSIAAQIRLEYDDRGNLEMKTKPYWLRSTLGVALLLVSQFASAANGLIECDRQCLYGVLDQYLAALVHRDPHRLQWAPNAMTTENNVAIPIGDGLWETITALGDYKLKFADAAGGQVGFYGLVTETKDTSAFALRIKVERKQIIEVETLVFRLADNTAIAGGENPFAHGKFFDKPILLADVPVEQRRARERMLSIADGYFDTLQLNDGTLFTPFDDQCNRYEDGVQTTNNPALAFTGVAHLGCADQFKLGFYRYDDRLRARRYPVIDEERGLVMAAGFIDHAGKVGTYKLTDGRVLESPVRRPHSYYYLELFKIKDGKIIQIESVFMTVPYRMQSPWYKE